MSSILPFIVAGVALGSLYGLSAVGLVLTYKTSGIFNFGHGALATAAAYVFYWTTRDLGWDWRLGAVVAVLVLGPLMGLLMELISRRLAHHQIAWQIVGTIGIILFVQGLGSIRYGTDRIIVEQYLPQSGETFRLVGVNIQWAQLQVAAVSLVLVAMLYVLFRKTRLGISMRAVVDDPELLSLQGTSPTAVRRISWVIGSTLAALTGVLILPFIHLEPIVLTLLVVVTFGAAAIGQFSSIPWTFIGGITLGIGSSVLTKYELDYPVLTGASGGLPFIVLIIVMVATPARRLLPPSTSVTRPALLWHGPRRLRVGAYCAVVGSLIVVPFLVGSTITAWTRALTVVIVMLSLGLLVRTAGMVSLATAAFSAIGAVAASQFIANLQAPFVLAVLLAGVVAIPLGVMLALPSLRLSGLFLALATLGFGLLAERLFYRQSYMFSASTAGKRIPRPAWAATDLRYYFVVLAFVVSALLLMAAIDRSRLGRISRGISGSAKAMSTLGLDVRLARVTLFCVSGFLASIAGALYGGVNQIVTAEDAYFGSFTSITLVAVLALAPFRSPWYAFVAGLTQVIPVYVGGNDTLHWLNVLFGFFAIVVAIQGGPAAMPMRLRTMLERRFASPPGRSPSTTPRAPAELQGSGDSHTRRGVPKLGPGLEVHDLRVSFGGLTAVDGVSLSAPMGRITGLIGPNGAGKTTTFNACGGMHRLTSTVCLHGVDVSGQSPPARARRGLGRTFQMMELCEALTVRDNVALGREASQAGAHPISQVRSSPAESSARDFATQEALTLCGIAHLAEQQAGALSTGERRLVELARCLAGPFDVLLLDEPSSGLDGQETQAFGELLQRVVADRGCGVLLVEHDVALVMEICQFIYVMDSGRVIFEGTPDEVAENSDVQAAYLGLSASSGEVDDVTDAGVALR